MVLGATSTTVSRSALGDDALCGGMDVLEGLEVALHLLEDPGVALYLLEDPGVALHLLDDPEVALHLLEDLVVAHLRQKDKNRRPELKT